MGVYHLMGLGRSPGTVIGPLTYLAHRYQRWNDEDQRFFARSGEVRQRAAGQKVGDLQALVLFTTQEIIQATRENTGDKRKNTAILSYDYIDNPPGRKTSEPKRPPGPMRDILRDLLQREWPAIAGGRPAGTVFWCAVDRRDIRLTYERVVRVIAALAGTGGQGKEMWINLTGGNNVINLALELAAALSGDVARLYYVQAEDEIAERCVRFTAEDGYWVDLPIMPLAFGRLRQVIIDLLTERETLSLSDLYSRLRSEYWDLSRGLDSEETLREEYLKPLWKQGILTERAPGVYTLGPQWELVRPYQKALEEARGRRETLEALCEREDWIQMEEIRLG